MVVCLLCRSSQSVSLVKLQVSQSQSLPGPVSGLAWRFPPRGGPLLWGGGGVSPPVPARVPGPQIPQQIYSPTPTPAPRLEYTQSPPAALTRQGGARGLPTVWSSPSRKPKSILSFPKSPVCRSWGVVAHRGWARLVLDQDEEAAR